MTIICLLAVPVCLAQDAPLPGQHPLQQTEAELKAEKEKARELRKEMKLLKNTLDDTKGKLVRLSGEVRANEKNLSRLENRIRALDAERAEIEQRLEHDRGGAAQLVLALERIRRIPPEAMLVRPGAPMDTARSAMLLHATLPRLYNRAESLRKDLGRLETVIGQVYADRAAAQDAAKKLETQRTEMAGLITERERLYARTEKDHKRKAAEIQEISARAKNLKDLVGKLEEKNRQEESARRKNMPGVHKAAVPPKLPGTGPAQLPVSGTLLARYGEPDEIGAPAKGIRIAARPRALVVAPMGGIVQYAGPFRNYGQLVIIEHKKEYHSLVAGLDRIDTVVGRAVSSGEPIGLMGRSEEDSRLYYELRYKGQPVDPARRFSGLQ